jgi:hypothetical protein
MATITVTVRADQGELGTHPKYGPLIPGNKIIIDENDFGAELFERPAPDYLSPLELKDKERAAELGHKVGKQEPPALQVAAARSRKDKEVTANA